jgi:hypothetical protein
MWLAVIAVATGLAGLLCAMLMGVTVIGVCRYGDGYSSFFYRFQTLDTLGKIKKMAGVYLGLLNKFVGEDVGFKHEGLVPKHKFFGLYIEHLLLFYWMVATILVLSFRPVEPPSEHTSSLLQAGAFFTLLSINVLSDSVSLLWTKRCIALLATPSSPVSIGSVLYILFQDVLVSVGLLFLVQLASNALYAFEIGRTDAILDYMLNWRTALAPYVLADQNFANWRIPGQLLITLFSAFIPTAFFYFICLCIVFLKLLHTALFFVFDVFNIDPARRKRRICNPLSYVGSLAGILSLALTSIKFVLDYVR